MTCEELKLECLKLALDKGKQGESAVTEARIYSDYVLGARDAEINTAARNLGKLVSHD